MFNIKNRTLVISDIHGCYDEFNKLLGMVNYSSATDQLILLGDYIDRGKDSLKVLEFVRELNYKFGAITLRGNHDQMLLDWLKNPIENLYHYMQNGGMETIKSFIPDADKQILCWDTYMEWANEIKIGYWEEIDFLSELEYYHEDDKHIYVHAGINPNLDDWKNTSKEDFIWIRDPFLNHKRQHDKVVIHGHTPCVYLHKKPDIYFREDKIAIDGACAYGYQLNCLEITEEGYKQHHITN